MERNGKYGRGSGALVGFCLLLLAGAAGLFRLQIGQPSRIGIEDVASVRAAGCLPQVEIPVNSEISLIDPSVGSAVTKPPSALSVLQVFTLDRMELTLPILPVPAENEIKDIGGQELRFTRASGSIEFRLNPGAQGTLVGRSGARLTLQQSVRFMPSTSAVYFVKLEPGTKALFTQNKYVVPAGTLLGRILLSESQAASTIQPLLARLTLGGTPASLSPVRVTGQPGLADLSVETRRSAIGTVTPNAGIVACAQAGEGPWTPVAASVRQAGVVDVALTDMQIPQGFDGVRNVRIAVAVADGSAIAVGGLNLVGRAVAGVVSVLFTAALLWVVMWGRAQQISTANGDRPYGSGLFIGTDGDPSLSLFQIFFWTVMTVWGYFYVFIVAGTLLALSTGVMALLGIAGTGTVLARWAAVSGRSSSLGETRKTTDSSFWSMLNTNGDFDLLKLQLFVFTVVIGLYVMCRIADAAAFPELDTNTLLLLGVSQGVYITGKLVSNSKLSTLQAIRAELDLLSEANINLTKEKTQKEQDAANEADPQKKKKLDEDVQKLKLRLAELENKITELSARYEKLLAEIKLG